MREHKEYKENSRILAGDGGRFSICASKSLSLEIALYCNNIPFVKLSCLTDSLIQTTARNKQ